MDNIINSAYKLKENNNIDIVLVGDGVEKNGLIEKAKKLKLTNVKFFDPVPKNEIPGLLTAADAAIITLKKE